MLETTSAVVDRLEKAARRLTWIAFALLLVAGVGGVLFPATPAPAISGSVFRPLGVTRAPVRLVVPSLHIDAPIVPISIGADATLTPPSNFRDVGWWNASAKIGSATGQTVITGHTVHTGGGQMDHLGDISQGALIKVVTRRGTVWYRETSVITYTKNQLSRHARALFLQNRKKNRLELITCTGWTGYGYTSNVVVFADPLGVPKDPAKARKLITVDGIIGVVLPTGVAPAN